MSKKRFFAVGPTDIPHVMVSRLTTPEMIERGDFLLTANIEEAFIWEASSFANLFATRAANYRIKPVENQDHQECYHYLHIQQGIQTIDVGYHPETSRHPKAHMGYPSFLDALYARQVLERQFPHLGQMTVSLTAGRPMMRQVG